MIRSSYNRYELLKNSDGTIKTMPFVKIPERTSDKFITWNSNRNRLDKLAIKYYDNPYDGFFILYANPSYLNEFDIPDGALIRIPFPIKQVKSDYEAKLQQIINQ